MHDRQESSSQPITNVISKKYKRVIQPLQGSFYHPTTFTSQCNNDLLDPFGVDVPDEEAMHGLSNAFLYRRTTSLKKGDASSLVPEEEESPALADQQAAEDAAAAEEEKSIVKSLRAAAPSNTWTQNDRLLATAAALPTISAFDQHKQLHLPVVRSTPTISVSNIDSLIEELHLSEEYLDYGPSVPSTNDAARLASPVSTGKPDYYLSSCYPCLAGLLARCS